MSATVTNYIKFISENKTERECVKSAVKLAENAGFRNIEALDTLSAGDKVYINMYGKSIALFEIGTSLIEEGMNILCAHIDSPRLDLKMKPLYEKNGIVYFNTHYYGGIKKYQWVTMPLAIHGVVALKNGDIIEINMGEEEDDYTFAISDILPHIAQEQMKKTASEFIPGENLDLVIALNREEKKDEGKKAVLDILKERYAIDEEDFLSAELEVVPAGRAKFLGLRKDMVIGYGQDDRVCAYTSLEAALEHERAKRTCCCLLVDKEEIGSVGATGMDSLLLENALSEVLSRLGGYDAIKARRALRNSYMLSSDVNSALDPLNMDLYDEENSSKLGGGVVFNKYTGSRGKGGASDANAEYIAKLRKVMDENKVTFQMADMAKVDENHVMRVVTLETISANLGSMTTPVGNPQNLYICSFFNVEAGPFFRTILPYSVLSAILIALLSLFLLKDKIPLEEKCGNEANLDKKKSAVYLSLLLIALLSVFRLIDWKILFFLELAIILIIDRKILRRIDYVLLLTFVCFFIFSENMGRIEAVRTILTKPMESHPIATSALVSQIISNVPAAILLSPFSSSFEGVLIGTDIGGLGTPIASLASLISLKFYYKRENAKKGRYMAMFLLWNFILLAVLALFSLLF